MLLLKTSNLTYRTRITRMFGQKSNCLKMDQTRRTQITASRKNSRQPLVILLPWLGASKKGINKYCDLYKDAGMDVLVQNVGLKDFLWPKLGLASSKLHLDLLKEKLESERPILIHSFSIGCYYYALMIMNMLQDKECYDKIWRNIACQIMDSPVIGTLNEMAFGVSKMLSPKRSTISALYKNLILCYFAISKNHTVNFYEEGIDTIKNHAPVAPTLFVSCRNDPMLIPEALEDFVEAYRQRGCHVAFKMWNESTHAQHLRVHPEEYKSLIRDIVSTSFTNNAFHLKSKL